MVDKVEAQAVTITTVVADMERIERLLDVVEAVARVRMEMLIPVSNLALHELKQHGAAAQEQLDLLAAAEAEAAAVEAAKVKEEEDARRKKEEEANQPAYKGGEDQHPVPVGAPVRRELPPLSPPPAR